MREHFVCAGLMPDLFLAALLMAHCGCGGEQPPDPEPNTVIPEKVEEYVIVPATGMAPVAWGMTRKQVQNALGPAESITTQRHERSVFVLYYLAQGFTLTIYEGTGLAAITCFAAEVGQAFSGNARDFPGRTAEGIGLGSSRESVIAAYGRPAQMSQQDTQTDMVYQDMAMHFTLLNDKVVQFTVWAPREQLVEGEANL